MTLIGINLARAAPGRQYRLATRIRRSRTGVGAVKLTITYLEMLARTDRVVPPQREGLAVVHARRPTLAYYRFL
jgi:hypothetical protein